MTLKNKYTTLLLSALLFAVFFSYYFMTSNMLPHGAGPDWKSNTDVTQFIYENGRLAVLPDDEKDLHYTVYGGTRALRPPLSYIVSAATAGIFSSTEIESHILFRKGSALLCALAVALTFYVLTVYFLSYRIALLGAFMIGLMPQFTFIASYNNDDSGAIFAATLMLAVLVRIYRYGVSNTNAALMGLAGGLVIISKMTAWLMIPMVIVFLVIFIRATPRVLLRYVAIASVVFLISGGWWLVMNMQNYGISDPIATKITSTSAAEHRRLPPDAGVGFSAQGIGYVDLLVRNHNGFLGATARSTIGNLDWLKLKVGPLQYTFYLAIFYLAIIYYFFSVLAIATKLLRRNDIDELEKKQILFESVLVTMIVFQFFMYTWTNINNDIQMQGKYLIPVFLALLILFFSGIRRISGVLDNYASKNLVFISSLLIITGIHWHAWLYYVVPFYQPPAHVSQISSFRYIHLDENLHIERHNLNTEILAEGIRYTATGVDPKAILKQDFCKVIAPDAIIRLNFFAEKDGTLQFFIDEGKGFSIRNSVTAKYRKGENKLLLPISARECKRLRFDPFTVNGPILLKYFEIAPMSIRERRY